MTTVYADDTTLSNVFPERAGYGTDALDQPVEDLHLIKCVVGLGVLTLARCTLVLSQPQTTWGLQVSHDDHRVPGVESHHPQKCGLGFPFQSGRASDTAQRGTCLEPGQTCRVGRGQSW